MSVETNRKNEINNSNTNRSIDPKIESSLWHKRKGEIWEDENYKPWQDEGTVIAQPTVDTNRISAINNANTNR